MREAPRHRFAGSDLVAGLSVALVLAPQSMAYAELAGLPSQYGLYAAALPPIAAGFFASSPYLQTGPTALTALLTLGALLPLAPVGSAAYIGLAALLALVVGVVRIAVGALRGGWLSYLMSRPILIGFTAAAAVLIVASQLPGAAGVVAPDAQVLLRAWWVITHPGSWEVASVALSAMTVLVVLLSRRIHPLVPGVLIAAVIGMVYSVLAGYSGPTVGEVSASFPPFSVELPWRSLPGLLVPGAVIAIVGFAEAASISRIFAAQDRVRWDANQEFVGQGAANVVASLTGGFPVGGSFSRSSLNQIAGASSRWSGVITGVAILAFLPFAWIMAPLPRAVLAGIVIAAVGTLVKPKELFGLWSLSRPQAFVGFGTFAATLLLAPRIEQAVLLGVAGALAVHLLRELRTGVEPVVDGTELRLEVTGVLWFGSAPALEDKLFARLADEPSTTHVVIECGGLGRIDLTGAHSLLEIFQQVRAAGLSIRLENAPEHAHRILRRVAETEGVSFVAEE